MSDQPSPELLDQFQQTMLETGEPVATPEGLMRLIDEALELQEVIEGIEESLKTAKARFDTLRRTMIPDAMRAARIVDASGHGKITHRSGAKVHLRNDLHAYVLAEQKPSLITWLKKHGHGDLVKEEVHHSTLKAFCKELLEDGGAKALPPMVKTSPETVAVISISRKKGE